MAFQEREEKKILPKAISNKENGKLPLFTYSFEMNKLSFNMPHFYLPNELISPLQIRKSKKKVD